MQSLILAAGYATRLYPLTKDYPKPLLKIGGISILDRLLQDLDQIDTISQHIIVSNQTFLHHFEEWRDNSSYRKEIVLINDETTSNENRLGAVKDILFVLEKLRVQDDLLVLAGDNVIDFSFKDFVGYATEKETSCITCHEEPSIAALQKTGVLEMDSNGKVIAMHEKPQNPPSHWAVPPFYYYSAKDLPLIQQALANGCDSDAPGNLIGWLCKQTNVYAWPMKGNRYDIGDLTSYQRVNTIFGNNESE